MADADEGRHHPGPGLWWHEAWVFEAWTPAADVGLTTALVLLPNQGLAWYWAMLVRADQPLLHLAVLDAALPVSGLMVRTTGLWADHICEAPFEQWTVANEAHAVALDDPDDATGRAYGVPEPLAFDLEWYATGVAMTDAAGYEQPGEVDGVVELASGHLDVVGPARRRHSWGGFWPTPAVAAPSPPRSPGLRAPVALDGPYGPWVLDRVLTADGWWEQPSWP